MELHEYHVLQSHKGERIDKFLTAEKEEWSRTLIQQWVKEGHIKVNEKLVKPNYKIQEGDTVSVFVPEPEPANIEPEKMNLDIYYEDDHVLVVNKPRGMVVHPAPGHLSGTLVNGLMDHCKDLSGINGVMRPGIVHRIDKDTSGLLMVAKNDRAHESLVNQLVNRTVTRRYKAVVHGIIPHDDGTIDAPIGRDKKDRQSMTVTKENSKHAVTHFHVLERFDDFTYIECRLETGRTHQIRVHMKYIGFPLAGDPKYGPRKTVDFPGQVLHAGILGFHHPATNEYLEFEAPLQQDMKLFVDSLKKKD
jgi:23S rRNA pseudouridine1911/1915/1917 synthase